MEDTRIANYLNNPLQIQKALDLLDQKCTALSFNDLYNAFVETLCIEAGDGFPITRIYISGQICRARVNTESFILAEKVAEIGINRYGFSKGRANPVNYPVFYGANTKSTAAFEVLQNHPPGSYIVTIGCWSSSEPEITIVNLIDGSDTDFKKVPFAHSYPKEYMKDWPELSRQSASLLFDYFRTKFKQYETPGLYNITNVIATFYYCLGGIKGIGYGAVSDKFDGFNIAIVDPSELSCVSVERWLIQKIDNDTHQHRLIQTGTIHSDGTISWQ